MQTPAHKRGAFADIPKIGIACFRGLKINWIGNDSRPASGGKAANGTRHMICRGDQNPICTGLCRENLTAVHCIFISVTTVFFIEHGSV